MTKRAWQCQQLDGVQDVLDFLQASRLTPKDVVIVCCGAASGKGSVVVDDKRRYQVFYIAESKGEKK